MSIFEQTHSAYVKSLFSSLGKGKRHAQLLYSEWFRKGHWKKVEELVEPQAISLIHQMIQRSQVTLPKISACFQEGDLVKFLLQFPDGKKSESVLIPMQSGTTTLCISSQVGCARGCAFCQTGKMGLIRNLTTEEIVQQVFIARFGLSLNDWHNKQIRNIVFMGMGEPLDNYEAVMQAIAVLTDPYGLGFAASNITISTSGKVDGILRMAKEAPASLNLAVSVNAPNDTIRNRLMPINRTWDMAALKEAMQRYCEAGGREILAEYVLIEGINDALECAEELAAYLRGLAVKINLIPYNAQAKNRFKTPCMAQVDAFAKRLRSCGYHVLVRTTKGDKIMAACGQLGKQ